MLDHRPIRILSEAEIGWPCRPVVPGPWRDIHPRLILSITAEGARRDDLNAMLPSPFERMRALPLAFYPEVYLVEGLARYALKAAGVIRMLLGPRRWLLLDGHGRRIHDFNEHALQLHGQDMVDDYLRFFCGNIRGNEGPFNIVERVEDIALNPALSLEDLDRLRAAVRPVERVQGGDGDLRTASVIYGTTLFRSQFRILASGSVQMEGDEQILEDVLERAPVHDGIWEVFHEPAA